MKLNRKTLRKMILNEIKKTILKESDLQKTILKQYLDPDTNDPLSKQEIHMPNPQQIIDAANQWLDKNVYFDSKTSGGYKQEGFYSEPVSAPEIKRSQRYDFETEVTTYEASKPIGTYIDENGVEHREYYIDSSPYTSPMGDLIISAMENLRKGKGAHTVGKDPVLQQQIQDVTRRIDRSYGGSSGGWMSDLLRQADPTGAKQRAGMRPDEISDTYKQSLYRNDPSSVFYNPDSD